MPIGTYGLSVLSGPVGNISGMLSSISEAVACSVHGLLLLIIRATQCERDLDRTLKVSVSCEC